MNQTAPVKLGKATELTAVFFSIILNRYTAKEGVSQTKEDFEIIRQQVSIETIAGYLLEKDGRLYKFPGERTGSIRIYPETQSFYDYGRGHGGDCIALWSHIKDVDSWTALCQIRETFNLNTPNRANSRDLIRQQELLRQQQKAAQKAAKRAWVRQVDELKQQCSFYQAVLNSEHCEPLSWQWCVAKNALTAASGRLDLLCGV